MFRICAAARLRRTSALCLLGTLSIVLPPALLPALCTEAPDSALHAARPHHNRADSTQIVQRAREATTAFLRMWRHAWLRSDYAQWTALERSMPRSDNPRYDADASVVIDSALTTEERRPLLRPAIHC
jgi:hypothetical protein